MSITLISGTPGAGKTLYAISKLLLPLVGTTVKGEEDGVEVTYPRTIYTNINGLLIDHELIQADTDEGAHNWHKWAKPGAVVVLDEVQKIWPPRPNGAKVPDDISSLDTHRHMGVDFIVITQNLMNVDRHVHALIDRHLHVRRVAVMGAAIVYEWDHASKGLLYSKAMTKKPWRYDKRVFKLYKSARLHTKPRRSMPGLVWFVLAGVLGLSVLGPTAKARLSDRFSTKPPAAAVAAKPASAPAGTLPLATVPPALPGPVPAVLQALQVATLPTELPAHAAGCAIVRARCSCFDPKGVIVPVEHSVCLAKVAPGDAPPAAAAGGLHFKAEPVQVPHTAPADLELAAWVHRSR